MFEFFKKMFGSAGPAMEDIRKIVADGAIVIDVRSQGEFRRGNVHGSKNIPIDDIGLHIKKIESFKKPIVVCCASGMRSARAASILRSNGIPEVYNAGSWINLQS